MAAGTLTILFTDLVGSTEILSRLREEGAEKLRQAHFTILREAVARHEGEEVKNLGDGLMVVFESTLAGVNCAVAMQQALERHNRRASTLLSIRIGMSVGEPTQRENDYFGTPVVEASRLCAQADGGQILASEVVRLLVGLRGGHTFRSMGSVELKGLPEPVAACEVAWEPLDLPGGQGVPLQATLAAGERSAFVGREDALQRLVRAWERARTGERQLVLLAGEPGIGKTRIAIEFARRVHAEGSTVLFGRSDEETLIPYQPFVEALRHYCLSIEAHEIREQVGVAGPELVTLVPELARRVPGLPEPLRGDPEGDRFRLFESVATLLRLAAEATPLVLILDDLHWADKPTLLLLKNIIREPVAQRLLIVGTYRETDLSRSHPLSEVMADLRRERLFERVSLGGLNEANVASLMAAMAGVAAPPDVVRAVHDETDGNPFFIEEVLRHLAESGAFDLREGRWASGLSVEEMGIPEGVREVVGRRLNRLSESCNKALAAASAIGRQFGLDVLERVAGVEGDALFELIEEAVAAHVLEEVHGEIDRYSFSHALIRQVLYEELTAGRRVRLHRQIGQSLEAVQRKGESPNLAELAFHFFEAATGGDTEKAIEYSIRAAEQATSQAAYEEAAGHYVAALQVLEMVEPDLARECDLLLGLGQAQRRAGEARAAMETFKKVAGVAASQSDGVRRAVAALNYEQAFLLTGEFRSKPDPSAELMKEALAGLGQEPAIRSRLLASLARAAYYGGELGRSAELSVEAVAEAQASGDGAAMVSALDARRTTLWTPDHSIAERLDAALACLAQAEKEGDVEVALESRKWIITALLERGDVAGADAQIQAYATVAESLRQPAYSYSTHLFRGMRASMSGEFAEVSREVERTLAVGARAGSFNARIQALTMAGISGVLSGNIPALREWTEAMPDAYPVGAVWFASEQGNITEAQRGWARLRTELLADMQRDFLWKGSMSIVAEIVHSLDYRADADRVYELLVPFSGEVLVVGPAVGCVGPVDYYLGTMARLAGRYDQALEHFAQALALNRRMGAKPYLARTVLEQAKALRGRGAAEDRETAAAVAREALEAARAMGMAPLEREASELLLALTPV